MQVILTVRAVPCAKDRGAGVLVSHKVLELRPGIGAQVKGWESMVPPRGLSSG